MTEGTIGVGDTTGVTGLVNPTRETGATGVIGVGFNPSKEFKSNAGFGCVVGAGVEVVVGAGPKISRSTLLGAEVALGACANLCKK